MLFIEYDVGPTGEMEVVALVNAVEENGEDPSGEEWLAWRRTHEDGGLGCAPVPPEELDEMEAAEDPDELRAIVERILMSDRAQKEETK